MSFLQETIEKLKENGKSIKDLQFGTIKKNQGYSYFSHSEPYDEEIAYFTIEDFVNNSDFQYDSGYGGNEIELSMKLIGKDFWLERHEYDGSEWWEYKELPTKPTDKLEIINFKRD